MTVVTISAQSGTGAKEVGRLVAQRLGIDYVDQEILVEAARALGVRMETVVPFEEERTRGVRERLPSVLRRYLEHSVHVESLHAGGSLDALLARTYGEAAAGGQTSIGSVTSAVRSEQPDLRAHAAPDGTVTLLFTDIENSTPLNERLGDQRWLELLRVHNATVRGQVAAHGGYEVKSWGDAFMVAFGSARRGLECAIAIQRAFAQRNEENDEPIRIRIGLHTGEAIADANDFYGWHVTLASRIANHARGGEILVSSLLKGLTERAGDVRFGEGREVELKGLSGTQLLFHVEWGVPEVSDDRYLSTVSGVIRDLAAQDNVVIIGRGSQVILKDWPTVVHVLLVAPLDHRIDEYARREGVTPEEAARCVQDVDKARESFHVKFFKIEVDRPSLYHLAINMGRVSFDEATSVISDFAQRRTVDS
jgi:class 3 adenylate cyclase/cytidylate kinase